MRIAMLTFAAASAASALVFPRAVDASSVWTTEGGISCQTEARSRGWIETDYRGATNIDELGPRVITCPTTVPVTDAGLVANQFRLARVYLNDRSSQPFFCSVYALGADGAQSWSPNRWACSTVGGCGTVPSSHTSIGERYLEWTIALQPVGGIIHAGVSCNVPRRSTTNGPSTVRGLWTLFWLP